MALMLLVGIVMYWRSSFRRELGDAELARYLAPDAPDMSTSHGLVELSRRIERKDPNRKQFYPAVLALAKSPKHEKRKVAAWLMGYDPEDEDFEHALTSLIEDPMPVVRFNAAPALALHKSAAARPTLLEMLKPSKVVAATAGVFHPKAKVGEVADWQHPLGMVKSGSGEEPVFPTTPGRILTIAADGATVAAGTEIVTLAAGQAPALHALGALTLPGIGRPEDAAVIEAFLAATPDLDDKVRNQAKQAILAVKAAK
jgi:hypothetical protein